MSRVILVGCDLLLPDLEAYTFAISGIVQQWQGELRPQALSQTLDFIGQEWFEILQDAGATTAKLAWLKSFIQFPDGYPSRFTPRQIDFSEQDLLILEVQEADRLQVPLVCFEAEKYEQLCRQLGSRVYVVDIDNLPLLALHHQLQLSSHASFAPVTTSHHPDPVENLPVPTVETELPVIDARTPTLEFDEEIEVSDADPTPQVRSSQSETNLQAQERPVRQLDSEGRVKPTLNRSVPPADTLPLLIFFLLAKLLPARLTSDYKLENLIPQHIEALSQVLPINLAAIANPIGTDILKLLQPSLVLQPVGAATVSKAHNLTKSVSAGGPPAASSIEQPSSRSANEVTTNRLVSDQAGSDVQTVNNTGWLDVDVDLAVAKDLIDQTAQLKKADSPRLIQYRSISVDNRPDNRGFIGFIPNQPPQLPQETNPERSPVQNPPISAPLPTEPPVVLRPPTPIDPPIPNPPPVEQDDTNNETPSEPEIPPSDDGTEPSTPRFNQGEIPSGPPPPDATEPGTSPAQPSENPTDLANPVGNTIIEIGAGQFTIKNFGGVGRGVTPSAAVVGNVDTLKFSGAGLTPENLLLNQRGNDLVITFETIPELEITLKDFRLENLDNLTTATWASITVGNILFNGQDQIEDSFDVINAEQPIEQVLRPDTVTFLNPLDNQTQGQENSSDVIDGLEGDDRLSGLSGDDKLRGGNGVDQLYGDSGNDYLLGGTGDDLLDGGSGINRLNGGAGRDQFLLSPETGFGSIIEDFRLGEDRIQLTGGITPSQISTQIDGNNTLLLVNNQPLITLLGVQISDSGLLFG